MEQGYVQKNIKKLTFTPKAKEGNSYKLADAPTPINYSLIDGRLVFESEEDWNTFVTYIDVDEVESWQNGIGFASMYTANTAAAEALDDNPVAATLNANGVVQIGKYIIKMIPNAQKVLVMDKSNLAMLHDLENAIAGNAIIQEFTFSDVVFEQLEEQGGVNGAAVSEEKRICRDRYAIENRNYFPYRYSSSGQTYEYRIFVEYKKIGISVKLYSHFANAWPSSPGGANVLGNQIQYYKKTNESTFATSFMYTPRCKPTVRGFLVFSIRNRTSYELVTYRGSRDCKEYLLTTTFSWTDSHGTYHGGWPFLTLTISDD